MLAILVVREDYEGIFLGEDATVCNSRGLHSLHFSLLIVGHDDYGVYCGFHLHGKGNFLGKSYENLSEVLEAPHGNFPLVFHYGLFLLHSLRICRPPTPIRLDSDQIELGIFVCGDNR